jgi:hypothetical protein
VSLSAAVIDALVANGVTVEQLAAAVKADLAEGEGRIKAKREKDAARQRKSRMSRGVTVTRRDATDAPPNEVISNPPVSSEPEGSPETPTTPHSSNGKTAPVSPEQVIEAWNVMADGAGVPKAKMTPERQRKLRSFVRRHPIDDITEAIWAVPRSPFLCGENDRGWKAGIDFLLQPSSFTKLIEGTYDRSTH